MRIAATSTPLTGCLILDTNVLIAYLADEPTVVESVESAAQVYLPAPALGQLFCGAAKSGRVTANENRIGELMSRFVCLVVDRNTARYYGSIKHALRAKGRPMPENDIWIAAIARQYNLPLATRDAHFTNGGGVDREAALTLPCALMHTEGRRCLPPTGPAPTNSTAPPARPRWPPPPTCSAAGAW